MARIGAATVDLDEAAIMATVTNAVVSALDAAGDALVAKYRRILNTPYPPASRPGQPPHRRSGHLRDAQAHRIARDAFGVTLIVGVPTSSPYSDQARFLADGTKRMKARPWIDDAEVQAAAVLAQGMVGQAVGAAL